MTKEVPKMDNPKFFIAKMPDTILITALVSYVFFRKKSQTRITNIVIMIALLYYFVIIWDRAIH
jgi:hypothetical protein